MARILAWAVYPAIVGGGMFAGGVALARGYSIDAVIIIAGLATIIVVGVLERLTPHVPRWNRNHQDVVPDLLHAVVSNALPLQLINVFALAAVASIAARIEVASLWPASWPFALQIVLAFVVGEFGVYWAHRLLHARLWRLHELHHSAERMYWLNGFRNHPLDAPLQYASTMVPLVLVGAGPDIIGVIALFQTIHTPLQHSNVAMRCGPLSYVFATAELHRWHHAPEAPTPGANYGTNLILWDLVFGTFRRAPAECTNVGLPADTPAFPHRYLAQLASPFRDRATAPRAR